MEDRIRIGICGGYFAYTNFWIVIATELLRLAREAIRVQRAEKAREARVRRTLARRPVSLNPPPDAAAVSAQWRRAHDSLIETLRFGSLLLDLEPTVDSSPVMRMNKSGTREVIVARRPGLKGWLHQNCRVIGYQTAMRYKTLAERTRRACGLPRDVPLEWIFPDQAAHDKERRARTSAKLAVARAKLVELLAGCDCVAGLFVRLDARLAIVHRKLATPRKGFSPAAKRRMEARAVDALLGVVRQRLGDPAKTLSPEARALLLRGLLGVADELRKPTAPPAA